MDLCLKNETDLEDGGYNEIQSTEETELTFTCPDERSEKNHVYCLLSISDITFQQDERANEFIIGTGWEEAVQGWGRASPTACIWPRKRPKKARGEGAGAGCLLCASLSQVSIEDKSPEAVESEVGAEAGPEKDQSGPSQTQGSSPDPKTASREINKTCFPTYFPGQKKSLQIKEFIWCSEDWAISEPLRGKAPRSPCIGADRRVSISDALTSKALLVLPPLKASPPNALDVLGKKSKNFLLQSEEKVLNVEKEECVTGVHGMKLGDRKAIELAKHLKVKDSPPFPSPVAQTSLLADAQQCLLHWSLLPEKSLVCPPNPSSVRYLATLQLLQKQGVQNYKAKFKAKEQRPVIVQKHILTEAKQENGPQTVDSKLFPSPLLPSLTVSRVVIPISTHRLL
ncbi:uncharacterized protein C16orf46 homolog [Tupaia chinensis]|uniref:Uncharacterized protein n=1 Tax=Tupaia chinensis TaxID=246437 RepID=L9KP84_TUPCH|nr:uncharacterized protein C16orf46 homolog [Tupaia chinensis]XP_027629294.1 uncharacterized protein C16orf46 homolog [Tupaia chinensis]ELW62972.1 hypothetical protein TREES_T100001748 [Tupaia chinensis]